MSIEITFDQSMQEKTSGACFRITARDLKHAQQISEWLKTKCPELNGVTITKTVIYSDYLTINKPLDLPPVED